MNTAFPGPYAADSPEMQEHEKALGVSRENSPSPKGAASQGESGAGGNAGAGYTLGGPAKKGQGEAAKRDFGMMWTEASDEDKDSVVQSVADPLAAQGVSLEGGVMNALKQGGPHAMAAAQRWGIDLNQFADQLNPEGAQKESDGPTGNTPKAFKGDDEYGESRALTSKNIQADKKKDQKVQQRRAMGGFLMELGINILSSQRGDATGAIGEGLKTTFVEKEARKTEAADRDIIAEESKRVADLEAKEDKRAGDENTREQEEHEAKKAAGTLGSSPYSDNNFERQWKFYEETHKDSGKATNELRADFLKYFDRSDRLTKTDRLKMISDTREAINDGEAATPDGWYDMNVSEQNEYIKKQLPMLADPTDGGSGATNFADLPTE